MLVARRRGRVDGIALEAQALRDCCGDDCRVVVDTHDRGNRVPLRKKRRLGGGALGILERERDESAKTGRLKRAGLFRRDSEFYADLPRSLHERRRAVGRGRQQQQKAGGYFLEAWK